MRPPSVGISLSPERTALRKPRVKCCEAQRNNAQPWVKARKNESAESTALNNIVAKMPDLFPFAAKAPVQNQVAFTDLASCFR